MPRLATIITTLALLFPLSGCSRTPDPSTRTVIELLHDVPAEATGPFGIAFHYVHVDELLKRPRQDLARAALSLADSENPHLQLVAANAIGLLLPPRHDSGLAPELCQQLEAALIRQLEASSPMVRANAGWELASAWFQGTAESPPAEVMQTVPPLLTDPDPRVRAVVAEILFQLGAMAADAVPLLCRRLAAEPEPSTRFWLAMALSCHGHRAGVSQALVAALDDPERIVRLMAAMSLEEAPTLDAAALARLRRCLDEEQELDMLESCTYTLARHTRDAEPAESLLATALELDSRFAGRARAKWLTSLGLLAARVPRTSVATKARAKITAELASASEDVALAATAAMAGFARATDDVALAQRMAKRLSDSLPALPELDPADEPLEFWPLFDCQSALDALIDLATWPAASIDTAPLRAQLTFWAACDDRGARDWARRRLAELR